MNHYIHHIEPILVSFGPVHVRWYGLMYLIGFVLGYLNMARRYRKGLWALDSEASQTLITYLMIGMMIGARLVYVFVYNPMYYLQNWKEIPAIWMGGLSFHGAAIGFVVAMWLFSRHNKVGFFHLTDGVVLGSALGIFFGRMGNFINGELFGRVTDVPWGVIFPGGGPSPRHPSQLYQGLTEGLIVFLLLHVVQKLEIKRGYAPDPKAVAKMREEAAAKSKGKAKPVTVGWKRTGIMGTSFLILYAIGRFVVEFFREPDAQLGFFAGYITMGQILCFIMGLIGIVVMIRCLKKPVPESYSVR